VIEWWMAGLIAVVSWVVGFVGGALAISKDIDGYS
jgi:hypothetical protein